MKGAAGLPIRKLGAMRRANMKTHSSSHAGGRFRRTRWKCCPVQTSLNDSGRLNLPCELSKGKSARCHDVASKGTTCSAGSDAPE